MAIKLLCSISSCEDAEFCLRYWELGENEGWAESLEVICDRVGVTLKSLEERVAAHSSAYVLGVRLSIGTPVAVKTREQYEKLQSLQREEKLGAHVTSGTLSGHLNLATTVTALHQRTDLIEEALQDLRRDLKPVEYSSLEFLDAFYLYCILVAAEGNWYDNELPPLCSYRVNFSSTRLLAEQVYSRLRIKRILIPSIHSPIFAFSIGDALKAPITFDTSRVSWTMAVTRPYSEIPEVLTTLRSLIESSRVEALEALRRTLIAHECVNVVVSRLNNTGVRSNLLTESSLLTGLQYSLRRNSVKATLLVIKRTFADPELRRKMKRANPDLLGTIVSEKLTEYADEISFAKFSSNINDPIETKLLRDGKSVLCRVFQKLM
jgi:hypothetical protein